MPDRTPAADRPDALPESIEAMLADPALWDEPTPGLEDQIVAAVTAAREESHVDLELVPAPDPVSKPEPEPEPTNVSDLAARRHRSRRPAMTGFASGIAAALALLAVLNFGGFLGGDGLGNSGEARNSIEVTLAATDLAPPTATADAVVTEGALGTRLVIRFEDLPAAEDGTYYEAWLRQSPEIGVSAGTFHLRGGDGEIELWSAVSPEDYPLLTVTLQQEDAGAASSGQVVLAARLDEE